MFPSVPDLYRWTYGWGAARSRTYHDFWEGEGVRRLLGKGKAWVVSVQKYSCVSRGFRGCFDRVYFEWRFRRLEQHAERAKQTRVSGQCLSLGGAFCITCFMENLVRYQSHKICGHRSIGSTSPACN